jgi:hypothetical protein
MRIGRIGFVVGTLLLAGVAAGAELIGGLRPFHLDPEMTVIALRFACVVGGYALVTWRCHDFNQTFSHVFWIEQTPFIGQFWALWLLLTEPGTDGMNSFGHPFPI